MVGSSISIGRLMSHLRNGGHHRAADALEFTQVLAYQLLGERVLRTSAALAFTSILALVPLLAVSFAIVRAFVPHGDVSDAIRTWMLNTLLADSVSGVVTYIQQFLEETRSGALGLVGLSFLLVTSLALFLSVERAVNGIWRVGVSRPLYRRLITFYAVITLTPAFIGLGSLGATWVLESLAVMSLGLTLGSFVSSLMVLCGLTLMYKLMPHTHVRWKTAVFGGIWATLIFQLSRLGFNGYVDAIYTGSVTAKIYGAFALIPIFFLWLHLSWIIILSGVTVSYLAQNRGRVAKLAERHRRGQKADFKVGATLILNTFLIVADGFYRRGGGTTVHAVCEALSIDEAEVMDAVGRLREHGFVVQVTESEHREVMPAKPLAQVTLADVLSLARHDDVARVPTHPALSILHVYLERAQHAYDETVQSITIQDILQAGPD
ncbi:MAG: YhjD/YihY/BrkB family envelope integrity protein [Myxococcota bacterium]|nr:YhjD/YihY/BrkB family envelope integrity protein [Myxococcota bacterium]